MPLQNVPLLNVVDLGLIDYDVALERQRAAHAAVCADGKETVFVLEHEPVITFGRNGGRESLRISDDEARRRQVKLVQSSRGGNITCHFPGQVVMYPIVRLDKRPGGVKRYVSILEESVIDLLAEYGVVAHQRPGVTGVFVGERKIASIGVAVKKWVAYHGVALNIGQDLTLFSLVDPCGMASTVMTSLEQERRHQGATPAAVDMQKVKRDCVRIFLERFFET